MRVGGTGIRRRHQPASPFRRQEGGTASRSGHLHGDLESKGCVCIGKGPRNGIEALYLPTTRFAERKEFHRALRDLLVERQIDLIVLAGFLVVLGEEVIQGISQSNHQCTSVADSFFLWSRVLWS